LGLTSGFAVTDLSWENGLGVNAGQTIVRYTPTGEALMLLDQVSATSLDATCFSQWTL
jgi:hypothetical protein